MLAIERLSTWFHYLQVMHDVSANLNLETPAELDEFLAQKVTALLVTDQIKKSFTYCVDKATSDAFDPCLDGLGANDTFLDLLNSQSIDIGNLVLLVLRDVVKNTDSLSAFGALKTADVYKAESDRNALVSLLFTGTNPVYPKDLKPAEMAGAFQKDAAQGSLATLMQTATNVTPQK